MIIIKKHRIANNFRLKEGNTIDKCSVRLTMENRIQVLPIAGMRGGISV